MRLVLGALIGLVGVVAAAALAACGGSDNPGTEETKVTEKGSEGASAERASDKGSDEARPGTKLASVTLDDGRAIELRAKGNPPYEVASPCLMLFGIDRIVRQCGRAPSGLFPPKADDPVIAFAYARKSSSAPLEVYGTTQPDVARVILEYGANGARKRMPAVLLEVTDTEGLKSAHISEPFGFYFGALPSKTSVERVQAIALDSEGEILGSADFGVVRPQPGGPEGFIASPTPG